MIIVGDDSKKIAAKTKQNGTVKNPQGWFSKQALVIIAGDDSKKIAAQKKMGQ